MKSAAGPFHCVALVLLFVPAMFAADITAPLVSHVSTHRDGKSPWSVDFAKLAGDRSGLPIGVFDSGIGGLTVLEAILSIDQFNNASLQPGADGMPDFAGERFIYFGDQANMPYGNYPSQGREDYLRELILKDAVFLLGTRWRPAANAAPRFDKPPVKAIVIACNTATAYGIEDMRAALRAWQLDVPVIGVVEAGARAVAERLDDRNGPVSVGVLATVGTCASQAYPKAIAQAAGRAGKSAPEVVQQGSVGLAGAIEGNPAYVWSRAKSEARPVPYAGPATGGVPLNSVVEYAGFDAHALVGTHLRGGRAATAPLRMVVLGCTHFPLVEKEICSALRDSRALSAEANQAVAERIEFINPAEHTAKELFRELARAKLCVTDAKSARAKPAVEFFFSVANPAAAGIKLAANGALDPAYKTGRAPGNFITEDTVAVPLTLGTLPPDLRGLVSSLPSVWAEIQRSGTKAAH